MDDIYPVDEIYATDDDIIGVPNRKWEKIWVGMALSAKSEAARTTAPMKHGW